MQHYDVAIVGAGPAGSATATFFAERGYSVALIDRARFPRSKPCGEYVSPEARRMLDRLVAPGELAAEQPAMLEGMRVVSPDGTSFIGRFSATHMYRGYSDQGIALPRSVLDLHLVQLARHRGATLLERTTLDSFDPPTSRSRTLYLRQGNRSFAISARLLVGADGIHSRVAKQLRVARRGALNRVALVAHAIGVDGMQPLGEMHVIKQAYVGLAPVGRGLTNVSVVVDTKRQGIEGKPGEWFHRVIQEVPEVQQRLSKAEFVSPIVGAGPFARSSTRATADRAVLVGDAADFYDPFTGEGIYAALRGAELVAELISPFLESDQLDVRQLQVYDQARRRDFRGKWLVERIIAWAVGHPLALNHVARRLKSKPELADLLVGVTGDFVPPSQVLRPGFTLQLVW
jgi:geranylgeranyl reductase family protein